jgi:putative ABC transport system substrate-binding protein
MKRHLPFLLLSLSLGLSAPSFVDAQTARKIARIGWLSAGSPEIDASLTEGLRRGLRELGYAEGKHFIIEPGFTHGRPEVLLDAARDLVRLRVDAIVASGDQAALAAKKATSVIPIVVQVADASGIGLVQNLARPGANITGVSDMHALLVPKRLEILKEFAPGLSRVAFLSNPTNPTCVNQSQELRTAAPSFGLAMQSIDIARLEDIESAFATMAKERTEAFILCGDRVLSTHRGRIYGLAEKNRLLGIYANRRFVESGGLASYGTNLTDVYRGLAVYIDKILRGAKPGDLPLQQPTKFELAINVKAAKTIGLSLPRPVMLRADYIVD